MSAIQQQQQPCRVPNIWLASSLVECPPEMHGRYMSVSECFFVGWREVWSSFTIPQYFQKKLRNNYLPLPHYHPPFSLVCNPPPPHTYHMYLFGRKDPWHLSAGHWVACTYKVCLPGLWLLQSLLNISQYSQSHRQGPLH